MEIRNLLTFMKVAEEQSLSKAAAQLGYAQSTVTMQMQQLEQELGIALYERVGRQIRITEKGQELLAYAAQIVKISKEAMLIAKPDEQKSIAGELRIGVSDEVGKQRFARQLKRYHDWYPDVLVTQISKDKKRLRDLLLHNEIDLMVTVDYKCSDVSLEILFDRTETAHFVTGLEGQHGISERERDENPKNTLEHILKQPLIHGDLESAFEQELEHLLETVGIEPGSELRVADMEMAAELAATGAAVAWLPDQLTENYVKRGELIRLDCEPEIRQIREQTICHRNKWKTGAMRAWVELLRNDK